MAPASFVSVGLKAVRHPRHLALGRLIAARAGHAGGSACAALWVAPGTSGVFLAGPAAVWQRLHCIIDLFYHRKPVFRFHFMLDPAAS